MKALTYNKDYPLSNPAYRWVFVHSNPYGPKIPYDQSFIFVDYNIAEKLKSNNIELMWATFTPHSQTVRIKSVNSKNAKDILSDGNSYETLTQMITNKRSTSRKPKNSFYANEWTKSAFNKNHTHIKPNTNDDHNHPVPNNIHNPHISYVTTISLISLLTLTLWLI